MKPTIIILIISVILAASAAGAASGSNARDFIAAMASYNAGDYAKAIALLEAIASAGIENGLLYYNLGNAHLKNGDLGRAILWYARATPLLPNDPDLRFNLDYARSLTRDAGEQETAALARILFFWKYRLSRSDVVILAIALNGLFWSLAIAWHLTKRRGLQLAMRIVLLPTAIFISTALFNYHETHHGSHAIVLPEKTSVRSGLAETSTELFVLHAGAKVKIIKKRDGYCQIRFSTKKYGWLPAEAVERI